jgi:hypothetical protein
MKVIGSGGNILVNSVFWILIFSLIVVILIRFGLFAAVVTLFVIDTLVQTLHTTDFTAWYGTSSLALLLVVGGMALYGFKLSLGGRSLLADAPKT